ncbi:MAG TPA: ABC transporter permease [Bacteroidia bacterium]|nr:ABC transporter permease [Bacteroidia bacterium]
MEQLKTAPEETDILPPSRFSIGFAELWHYRELFYFFTWRDIKVRYKQTFLGVLWALMQPLLMTPILVFSFGRNLQQFTPVPYPVFVFTGFVLWNIFSTGLSGAGNGMVNNANMIKKIYFPRLIIPFSSVLVAMFDFLMTLPVIIGIFAWYHCWPGPEAIFFFPAAIILTFMATVGAGSLFSALTVKYRDFRYVLQFLIQLLLFLSNVIYPLASVPNPWVRYLLALNPMSGAITLMRGMYPNHVINWELFGISFCSGLVLFVTGLWYFRKTETYFADLA